MPHSQPTALQQTVCKFHLDPRYHIFHWGSTILGDSTLCKKIGYKIMTIRKSFVVVYIHIYIIMCVYSHFLQSSWAQKSQRLLKFTPKQTAVSLKKSIQILWWLMTWPFKEPQHEQSLYTFSLPIIFLSLTWAVKAKCNWPQTICWHLKEYHSIIKQVALLMARIIAKLSTSRYTGGLNNACCHYSYSLCHRYVHHSLSFASLWWYHQGPDSI